MGRNERDLQCPRSYAKVNIKIQGAKIYISEVAFLVKELLEIIRDPELHIRVADQPNMNPVEYDTVDTNYLCPEVKMAVNAFDEVMGRKCLVRLGNAVKRISTLLNP